MRTLLATQLKAAQKVMLSNLLPIVRPASSCCSWLSAQRIGAQRATSATLQTVAVQSAKRGARTMATLGSGGGKGKGPVTWQSVGLLVCAGGGLVAYFQSTETERLQRLQETKQGKAVGKPDIGGPFELIDHFGRKTSDKDFRGKWMFIYFGFTYCPDICPNEMMRMTQILKVLDEGKDTKDKIQPIFITIDPERDGPEQLKDYLADWHSRIIGMTGTPEVIMQTGKKFRVYFTKARLSEKADDYLIDHSIMFYLMDDQGNFVDYFGKSLSTDAIADKITKYINGSADDTTPSLNSLGVQPIDRPTIVGIPAK